MTYMPRVDDYVVWERETWSGTFIDEGWVYFVGDPVEPKKGFPTPVRYITIETGVKPKPYCEFEKNPRHRNTHTLLLCYEQNWNELKYIKNRREDNTSTYKSQEHRYSDPQ